jgi:hypothetical protein
MSMIGPAGPAAMTCLLILAFAGGCGENGGEVSSTSSSTTEPQCLDRPDPDAVKVPIVVVDQDIPAGTTGAEAATNGMLREDTIPGTFRPATAITSPDQVADGVAVADLPANQVVTFEQFGLPTDTTLAPVGPELCDR